jgi:hypothetical protein
MRPSTEPSYAGRIRLYILIPSLFGANIGHFSQKLRSIEGGQAMISSVYLAGCHGATVEANKNSCGVATEEIVPTRASRSNSAEFPQWRMIQRLLQALIYNSSGHVTRNITRLGALKARHGLLRIAVPPRCAGPLWLLGVDTDASNARHSI